jgi:hypothetical protein
LFVEFLGFDLEGIFTTNTPSQVLPANRHKTSPQTNSKG